MINAGGYIWAALLACILTAIFIVLPLKLSDYLSKIYPKHGELFKLCGVTLMLILVVLSLGFSPRIANHFYRVGMVGTVYDVWHEQNFTKIILFGGSEPFTYLDYSKKMNVSINQSCVYTVKDDYKTIEEIECADR